MNENPMVLDPQSKVFLYLRYAQRMDMCEVAAAPE